ncbi:unnamed protein product [Rangifer tarandus platyrhynchus]|uniref:Uncharacterized protein n=1 Tax=Rangifer tarandus platyrhynchus TaxID=3082113 RepID=A0ABN8XLU2_RANTA|nr:unnamed protein product [Rangifer tarandus platyrhynchus]
MGDFVEGTSVPRDLVRDRSVARDGSFRSLLENYVWALKCIEHHLANTVPELPYRYGRTTTDYCEAMCKRGAGRELAAQVCEKEAELQES